MQHNCNAASILNLFDVDKLQFRRAARIRLNLDGDKAAINAGKEIRHARFRICAAEVFNNIASVALEEVADLMLEGFLFHVTDFIARGLF